LDGTDADIDVVCNEQPKLDRTQLRQTVRAAQKERAERLLNRDKPSTNQKKVFRLLREVFDPLSATNSSVDDDANDDVDVTVDAPETDNDTEE
ncbi:MAG TPA: DUF615 domain-containing protein, partial [Myxococcota bacterium]